MCVTTVLFKIEVVYPKCCYKNKSEDNAWTMKGASLCLSQDRGLQMAIVKNADFLKESNSYLNILVNHFIFTMHHKYNKKPTADLA